MRNTKGQLPPLSARRLGFKLPDMKEVPLTFLAEGEGWVVVSKPAGLLSVPGKEANAQDSALTRVKKHYPQATGGMVVHRLDLPTSGLLVFALNPDVLAHLNQQFATRKVKKHYTAVLERKPTYPHQDIYLPLRLDPFQRPLQIFDPVHGKPCHTRWELIDEQHPLGTKVKLYPLTGRTHQLRLHAAHPLGLNAPIVGDPHYSKNALADGSRPQGLRLHLHASFLSFQDPISGEQVQFDDPADF